MPTLTLSIFATREGVPLPGQSCVSVGGSVRQPGQIALSPGLTLAQAVQTAGGATGSGNTKRIRLFRHGTVRRYDLANPQHAAHRLPR